MNPARYIHTATWSREAVTITAGVRDRSWSSPASFACLVEALPGRVRGSLVGYIPHARYRITSDTELRENDKIVFESKTYILNEITSDTTRPTGAYYTGILSSTAADGS